MKYESPKKSISSSIRQGIVVVAVASAVVGCGVLNCTQAGCPDAVTLDLQEPVPFGEYLLTITTDGQTRSCVVRHRDVQVAEQDVHCDVGAVWFDVKDSIIVNWDPDTLAISIEHLASGETVSAEYEMDYEVSHPNGKQCGPKCRTARLTLDTRAFVSAIREYESSGLGGAGGMSAID